MLADDALIGDEGEGWEQVTAELAFERSGPERIYSSIVLLDAWLEWLRAQARSVAGASLALAGAHRSAAGGAAQHVDRRSPPSWRAGESPVVEAALVKDLGTDLEQAIPGADRRRARTPTREPTPPSASCCARWPTCSQVAPTFSLRGGTREILRGMIARGLGLR